MHNFVKLILLLLFVNIVNANSDELVNFASLEKQKRYQNLINEIRCPVCQGQSIGGSNSDLAIDLRNKVKELIQLDKTDEEIYSFMTERYGDFVVFKPPLNPYTYILWFAPIIFIIILFTSLFISIRNKNIEK